MITKKTKVFSVTSGLFLTLVCIALFLMLQYIQTQGTELLHQTKEVANYDAREQSYRELSQLVNDTSAEREELVTYILTEDKTIDFLTAIERIAVEQGVELTTNSLQVTNLEGQFDVLSISFDVEGTKARVYSLLQIFETLPYHAQVSGISFQNPEGDGSSIKGTIQLEISLLHI